MVVVDPGLQPGRHRFRLQVVNRRGVVSEPNDWFVIVETGTGPNIDVPIVTPGGVVPVPINRPVPTPPIPIPGPVPGPGPSQ